MKLYAVRYGKNFIYGTQGTIFRGVSDGNEPVKDFPFFYYLFEMDGKYTLVDTGFRDAALAAEMKVDLIPVKEELEKVFGGKLPVDTIFITHSHWDHINNLDLYTPERIIMAKAAYQSAMDEGTEAVKRILSERKITLVEEELLVDDQFLFRVIGGHTLDSSVLFFRENGKKYVITGDECYVQDNIYKNVPIGISFDPEKNEEFVRSCHEEKYIPLPFHDGGLLEKFERVSENIVRIF